jgi:ribosomal protein S18 acetylase RimI-like enzyme
MKIGLATIGDESGIAAAHVSAWQSAYRGIVSDAFLDELSVPERATRWAETLRDLACTLLVAKDNGQTLGFVSFGKSRQEHATEGEAEIWTLYVHPASWRNGVGKALMGKALTALQQRGFDTVWVWVLQQNARAIGFYLSSGFVLQPNSSRLFKLGKQELAEVALVRHAA